MAKSLQNTDKCLTKPPKGQKWTWAGQRLACQLHSVCLFGRQEDKQRKQISELDRERELPVALWM